jgi:hypothetical protein
MSVVKIIKVFLVTIQQLDRKKLPYLAKAGSFYLAE